MSDDASDDDAIVIGNRLWQRAAARPAADTSPAPLRSTTGVALIAATVLASGVGQYDAYVVNVAVLAIGRDLGASVAAVQWTLTGYLLSVAALLLVAGALADRLGRRRVLVIGLCVLFVSSILCASVPSIDTLIAARIVQGVGGALVVPTSLALLNGALRVSDRARGIGVWAGLTTLATTIGPYVGGWLVDHVSWRWVFLFDLPLILLALAALCRVPETSGARRSVSLDIVGALLAILGLGGLIYAVTEGAEAGWSSARILVAFVVGGLSLVALVPTERRRRAPMLRLSLFRSRQFDAINVTTVLVYGAVSAAGYLLVLQCQLQLGYSAAQAGAALIPASVVFLAVSPFSGALVARVGPRWLMVAGILVVATAFLWLSQAQPGDGYAAARLGVVIAIAVVPLLIGTTGGRSLARALAGGYEPAMTAVGAVSVAAAVLAGLFVADDRAAVPHAAVAVPRLRPARHPPGPSSLIRHHLDPWRRHGRLDHRFARAA